MGEVHENYIDLSKNYRVLKKPFLYALVANIFDVLTIYLVYLAFGLAVNPGAIILAYSIANFAQLLAVLPGGIGIYEPLMIFTSKVAGIKEDALILATTLLYRVFKVLVFAPIGYIYYHKALSQMKIFKTKA